MLSSARLYLLGSIAVVRGYYGECSTGDKYCQRVNKDPGSYCKFDLYEPVCHGGDQPCSCTKEEDCSYGDEFCQYVNDDATSRCDQRTSPPTCRGYRGGGQVCECSPTQCPTGDTYCQDINYDESSYCKYWLDIAVCQGGDQRCSCDEQQCASGDQFCRDFSGNPYSSCEPSRYGDRSFCSGTYQKCDCTGNKMCPLGNERCEKYVGYDSFCQYWDKYPTCSGSKVPCGCEEEKCPSGDQFCKYTTKNPYSMCESEDGRGGRCSGSYEKCDCTGDKVCSYGNERCESEVGYDSYCQYWEKYPTCSGSRGKVACQCESCASGDQFCRYVTEDPYSTCDPVEGKRFSTCSGTSKKCDCTGDRRCSFGNETCEEYVGYDSYCQYWEKYPTCSGTKGRVGCRCKGRRRDGEDHLESWDGEDHLESWS